MTSEVSVLFVCTANICRSPTAEGVFLDIVRRAGLAGVIAADSAGMNAWWDGKPPDSRTQEAALQRGIDLSGQRARAVAAEDFENFDLIFGMEEEHVRQMRRQCPAQHKGKIRNFMELIPEAGLDEMPDPYSGGPRGFELVLDLVAAGAQCLLAEIQERLPES